MSLTIKGSFPVQGAPYTPQDFRAFIVRKENRNFVHGVTWQALGNFLGVTAMTTAVGTLYGVGQLLKDVALDQLRKNSNTSVGLLKHYGLDNAPSIGILVTVATVANALFFKGVSACYEKAQYHLGPEYEVFIPPLIHEAPHPVLEHLRPVGPCFPSYSLPTPSSNPSHEA